jgi:DNA uptake protein ComE-like DNA-binding protein
MSDFPMRLFRLIGISFLVMVVNFAGAQSAFEQKPVIPRTQPAGNPLDINTATPQQLKALPGFGDAYARRVIAARPYSAKNQLVTRGVLPQAAYDAVSLRIVARHHDR